MVTAPRHLSERGVGGDVELDPLEAHQLLDSMFQLQDGGRFLLFLAIHQKFDSLRQGLRMLKGEGER